MKKGNITEILRYWEHINKLIRLKHRETAQKYDLTFEQFHLMIELDHHAEFKLDNYELPPTVGEIAADVGNAPHTLSERIKRLEKKGLVKKIRDEKDLRINRVMLTDKGQNLIDSIKNEADNIFIYNALEKMEKNSLNNLLNSLKQLNENLS
ncbi:MarR family winged helix-turn-helix transcriptional regulator [Methanobacterium sp. MBAC-LM]|uniref:MarR family winged helix-turn-helix transcriptional regulator n=1 Tax=Methanobacterium sp. MBAC-LM TaxID=3412034 RepID=UPI003C714566